MTVENAPRPTCADHAPAPGDIAVVGYALRVPGASTPDEFWNLLASGREHMRFFQRADVLADGERENLACDPDYVCAGGGVLDGIDLFDADFFGFDDEQARRSDPQQRLFLEGCWTALEHAGHCPDAAPQPAGLFAAVSQSSYLDGLRTRLDPEADDADYWTILRNDKDFLPAQVAYRLDLRGPCIAVQSASSSSLVAIHLACQSLRSSESKITLAGGVSIRSPTWPGRRRGYLRRRGAITSSDGRCRVFDAGADGTVSGDGMGVVVLRTLQDALAEGDTVHPVIKGSATNNDGAEKIGFGAPSLAGQTEVITKALRAAQTPPESLGYVEGHGMGTPIGDTIELTALARVFADQSPEPLRIGSVKSNFGHLNAAAGVVSIIKCVLALENAAIPPSLHFDVFPPEIGANPFPFEVATALRPWPVRNSPRRAGVSAFAAGGTNCHVVMQEAAPPTAPPPMICAELLTLSARSPGALAVLAANLERHLTDLPASALADAAWTLRNGRRAFEYRHALVAFSPRDASEQLHAAAEQLASRPRSPCRAPSVVLALEGTTPARQPTRGCSGQIAPASYVEAFRHAHAVALSLRNLGLRPVGLVGQGAGLLDCACLTGMLDVQTVSQALGEDASGRVADRTGTRDLGTVWYKIPVLALPSMKQMPDSAACLAAARSVEAEAIDDRMLAQFAATAAPGRPAVAIVVGAEPRVLHANAESDPLALTLCAGRSSSAAELELAGLLWCVGVQVDWSVLTQPGHRPRRLPLPTYPFQRRSFWWHDTASTPGLYRPGGPALGPERRQTSVIRP